MTEQDRQECIAICKRLLDSNEKIRTMLNRLKDYQQRLASNPGVVKAAEVAAVIGRILEGE